MSKDLRNITPVAVGISTAHNKKLTAEENINLSSRILKDRKGSALAQRRKKVKKVMSTTRRLANRELM